MTGVLSIGGGEGVEILLSKDKYKTSDMFVLIMAREKNSKQPSDAIIYFASQD